MSSYRLTTSFPYLARRVGIRIGELFDRIAVEHGISVSMYRVLASLMERDGQRLGDLSVMTVIEISTLSRLVGAMTRKGLVSRKRPRGNARIVEISLTPKGRKLAETLIPVAEHFEAVALGGMSTKEIATMKASLEDAFANLDAIEREIDQRAAGKPAAATLRRPRQPAASGA